MANDWQWRSEARYSSTVQKLDELEGLLREYAATKGITSVPAQGMGQIQPCDRLEDRTLFLKIHLEEYLISWEVLDQVFSSVGTIEVIEIFDNDPQYHSRIRFRNRDSVLKAFDSLNGRCIYDNCCRMELFVDGRASSGRLNQVEAPIEDASQFEGHQAPINFQKMIHADIEDIQMLHASLKDQNQSEKRQIAGNSDLGVSSIAMAEEIGIPGVYSSNCNHELIDSQEAENLFEAKLERQESTQIKIENDPNVGMEPSDLVVRQVFDEMSDLQICLEPELSSCAVFNKSLWTMSEIGDHTRASFGPKTRKLEKLTVVGEAWDLEIDKGMEETGKPRTSLKVIPKSVETMVQDIVVIGKNDELADESFASIEISLMMNQILMPYDRGKKAWIEEMADEVSVIEVLTYFCTVVVDDVILIFDPGGVFDTGIFHFESSYARFVVDKSQVQKELIWVFDPGGVFALIW